VQRNVKTTALRHAVAEIHPRADFETLGLKYNHHASRPMLDRFVRGKRSAAALPAAAPHQVYCFNRHGRTDRAPRWSKWSWPASLDPVLLGRPWSETTVLRQ
jgi:hypothetical protein